MASLTGRTVRVKFSLCLTFSHWGSGQNCPHLEHVHSWETDGNTEGPRYSRPPHCTAHYVWGGRQASSPPHCTAHYVWGGRQASSPPHCTTHYVWGGRQASSPPHCTTHYVWGGRQASSPPHCTTHYVWGGRQASIPVCGYCIYIHVHGVILSGSLTNQVLSFSRDLELRVWDLQDQICLQVYLIPHTSHITHHTSHITHSPPPSGVPQVPATAPSASLRLLPAPSHRSPPHWHQPGPHRVNHQPGPHRVNHQPGPHRVNHQPGPHRVNHQPGPHSSASLSLPSAGCAGAMPGRGTQSGRQEERQDSESRAPPHSCPLQHSVQPGQYQVNSVSTRSTVSVPGQQCQYQVNSGSTRSTVAVPGPQCQNLVNSVRT